MNEQVKVSQTPDKAFHVMFDDGITVADLAAALAVLPPGTKVTDVCTTFFDPDDEDDEGQEVYDDIHCDGITTLSTEPDETAQTVIAEAEALLAGGTA